MYSVGGCPVCPGLGEIVVLKNDISKKAVFYCPACCTAWSSMPSPDLLDEVHSIQEIAPGGVSIAEKNDIELFNLKSVAIESDTYKNLDEIL